MATAHTAEHPTLGGYWRRWRLLVWIVLAVLVTALVVGLISSQDRRGYLDPRGVDALGAGAVAQLLGDQGVSVTEARRAEEVIDAAGPDSTVLITIPDLLRPVQVTAILDTGADLVLVAPGPVVSAFDDDITVTDRVPPAVREPECDLTEAVQAGSVRLGGGYDSAGPAVTCYDNTLVVTTLAGGQRLAVLGTADPLTNQQLAGDGNAALVLNLLGRHPDLVWYRPVAEDLPDGQAVPLTDLLPGWVVPVVWQLGIAALLAAWWRGRRLGRVVIEPLPVEVRAAEATEGRARLYRRGRARGHAAATLREAAAGRLRRRLGLPSDTQPAALVEAVGARTGRPAADIAALLTGPEPATDPALVRLADDLDTLEQEVRRL
jgi:hypothetical protein